MPIKKDSFTLNRKISVGEFLTFITVVVSTTSLIISWAADRRVRIKENATRVRAEIAKTMSKINHVTQLQLSYYNAIEKDIVEASEISILEHNPIKARNYLWKSMHEKRVDLLDAIRKENWEIGYVDLLAYNINIDSLYSRVVVGLVKLDEVEFKSLLRQLEWETAEFNKSAGGQTAILSNELRKIKNDLFSDHKNQIEEMINPLMKQLKSFFDSKDQVLFFGK